MFPNVSNQELAVILTLVNWHLGAAIYALPLMFDTNGITAALLGLVIAAGMTYFVMYLLVTSAAKCGVFSYADLVGSVLGPVGSKALSILVILNAIGVFAAYFGILQDTLHSVSVGVSSFDTCLQWGLMVFVVTGCFAKNAWDVPGANELANGALVVLIAGLVYLGLAHPLADGTPVTYMSSNMGIFAATQNTLAMSIFSFSCAEVILTFKNDVKSPLMLLNAGGWAVFISFTLCALVGTLGALVRPGNLTDDVLYTFSDSRSGFVGIFVRVTNFLSIALSIPVFIINARKYLVPLVAPNTDVNRISGSLHYGMTLFLLIAAWKLQVLFPQLTSLITFVSSVTDGLFMLVFPSIIALYHLKEMPAWMKSCCALMLSYGLFQFVSEVINSLK